MRKLILLCIISIFMDVPKIRDTLGTFKSIILYCIILLSNPITNIDCTLYNARWSWCWLKTTWSIQLVFLRSTRWAGWPWLLNSSRRSKTWFWCSLLLIIVNLLLTSRMRWCDVSRISFKYRILLLSWWSLHYLIYILLLLLLYR